MKREFGYGLSHNLKKIIDIKKIGINNLRHIGLIFPIRIPTFPHFPKIISHQPNLTILILIYRIRAINKMNYFECSHDMFITC